MGRRDKDATRRRLIEAAVDVFADKGYNDTLIDDIASRSDTSKGAFYFHFPSKRAIFEALLQSLVDRLIADVETAIETNQGALAKIEAALRTVLSIFARHEKATRLLLLEASGLGKTFDRQVYDAHRKFSGLIARHLQHAVDDGSIAPIDSELVAYAWLGAIYEVLFMTLLAGDVRRPLDSLAEPLCQTLMRSLQRLDTSSN